ncbi:S-adenosyl-L-methionine-dependent methyltransferase [Pilobolus umbonatus]|nr:S-adenosyl-L-methionine-dependent methyltransferase [Pilobolus umbonatus]
MVFSSLSECFGRRKQLSQKGKIPDRKVEPIATNIERTSQDLLSPLSNSSDGKNFHLIDSRRFNNDQDVAYILPNDNSESDRLHFQHWALKYVLEGLYKSPVTDLLEKGITVVDAGCGPATWTFEMAETYPSSNFTGLDVSFVFPETIRPANVNFSICNIAKVLPFEKESIDFYHQRLLMAGLNETDMKKSLKSAYEVLKPGGYIELCEANTETLENQGPVYKQYNSLVNSIFKKKGLITDMGDHIESFLEESGFENIHCEKFRLPINHTNQAGKLMWGDFKEMGSSLKPVLTMVNPAYKDNDVYDKYINAIGAECAEYKTYINFFIAYGQKPV